MTFSIGPMPAFNVSKPDNSSNAAFFQGRPENEFSSFREIFRNTLKSGDRYDTKTAEEEDTKMELAGRAEIRQKKSNNRDPEPVNVGDENPAAEKEVRFKDVIANDVIANDVIAEGANVEKAVADDEAVKEAIVKELLMKLEKLNKMKDGENTDAEKQALLEGIKELLQELAEIRTEISGEEAAGICEMVSELENVPSKIRDAIIAIIEKPAGTKAAESAVVQKDTIPTEELTSEKNPDKFPSTEKADAKDNLRDESDTMPASDESQKTDLKTEPSSKAPVSEPKGDKAETADKEENIKAAVDAKVDKASAEENPERNRETGKNNIRRDAAKETHETIKAAPNKLDIEESAVRQEQNIIFGKAETVQNQAEIPKAQPVSRVEIINQIVKKAEVIITGTQSEMRMHLEPENLGKLTLSIAVERGLITAKFTAESYEVKKAIESNFNELRDMLQEKGLDIQNLSVSVGHENKEFNFSKNYETWRDKLKTGVKNMRHETYGGYQDEIAAAAAINPYSIHTGRFDQRA
ncbi:MAG TPA: flagellar hook-length control protein FliK [Bacillota bacterium]|nr:flagellar hook-length control protein FliK [Bacillota bacterium]